MSETRRATVMLIQRGDPEIGGALMAGVMEGRAAAAAKTSSDHASRATFTIGEGFLEADVHPVESLEIYTVEQDKWRRVARQVRVAVGNTRTAEDYRLMMIKARCEYGVHRRNGPGHTLARKLLLGWVMLCQGLRRAYRAQERVMRP